MIQHRRASPQPILISHRRSRCEPLGAPLTRNMRRRLQSSVGAGLYADVFINAMHLKRDHSCVCTAHCHKADGYNERDHLLRDDKITVQSWR